jgi:hypothetical protein
MADGVTEIGGRMAGKLKNLTYIYIYIHTKNGINKTKDC